MSRSLPASMAESLKGQQVEIFWACDLLFDEPNNLHFWNGLGPTTLDGITYTGAGDLLGLSEIRESSDIAAYGATLTLSGIPNELVRLALSEPYQGRKANVKFGTISSGIQSSILAFSGEMDQMNINYGPETATISLEVESRLVDLDRPRIRRYSDSDQKSRFPSDKGLEFVTRLQSERLEWEGS